MAKAVILRCDKCGEWDSEENRVQTVGVAGPRFDLCATDRATIIVGMGIDADKAVKYVAAFDLRKTHRGSPPPLDDSSVAVRVDDGELADQEELEAMGSEELDVEAPEAETVSKPAARRAAKK